MFERTIKWIGIGLLLAGCDLARREERIEKQTTDCGRLCSDWSGYEFKNEERGTVTCKCTGTRAPECKTPGYRLDWRTRIQ